MVFIGLVGGDDLALPWTNSAARDSSSLMQLLKEFLRFICGFITKLPPCVPQDKEEQTQQAKHRLFREVIHRLASGPKTHSQVSEVHHVLSHWDNVFLSEEGKLVNLDDATGAALATVLADIGDQKVSRGKVEPDKWEMKCAAWDAYDPAFFHIISLRSHQTAAAEGRPKPSEGSKTSFGWEAKPYAPVPVAAHLLILTFGLVAIVKALVLLQHLAVSGGITGGFIAQDSAMRSGAAWLCEFALACYPEAGMIIRPEKKEAPDASSLANTEESEIKKRKKMAREKAMASMKAQAAKFAAMMDVDLGSEDESDQYFGQDMAVSAPGTPVTPS
jgi:hypothetical protein